MQFIPWAGILTCGVIAGATVGGSLVLPRRHVPLAGVSGGLSALGLLVSVAMVWSGSARADALVASLFIAAGATGGGYALVASLLPSLSSARHDEGPLRPDMAGGGASVVLLADAEPETYEPRVVASTLARFEREDVPLPPSAARPLLFAGERARYDQAGGSPARAEVGRIASALSQSVAGKAVRVDVAYCQGGPTLSDAVRRAAADGARHVVAVPLTVAWSPLFEEAVSGTRGLKMADAGIRMTVLDPMWTMGQAAEMVAKSTLYLLEEDPREDGIVLVAEGSPWPVESGDRAHREQTTFFMQRVRAGLVEAGVKPDKIREAALDWEEPDVSEAVRHLAALGCGRVVLIPVTFVFETLSTAVDLRLAAERAATESALEVAVIPAWGPDPVLMDALRERVENALAD